MKYVYLALMAIVGIMGLIVCFENIMLQSPGMMIFFETMTGSMFWPLLFVMIMGFISGLFCGLAIMTGKKKGSDDFDEIGYLELKLEKIANNLKALF